MTNAGLLFIAAFLSLFRLERDIMEFGNFLRFSAIDLRSIQNNGVSKAHLREGKI